MVLNCILSMVSWKDAKYICLIWKILY